MGLHSQLIQTNLASRLTDSELTLTFIVCQLQFDLSDGQSEVGESLVDIFGATVELT